MRKAEEKRVREGKSDNLVVEWFKWQWAFKMSQLYLWWKPKRERLKDHKRALKRWADKHDLIIVAVVTSLAWIGLFWAW